MRPETAREIENAHRITIGLPSWSLYSREYNRLYPREYCPPMERYTRNLINLLEKELKYYKNKNKKIPDDCKIKF